MRKLAPCKRGLSASTLKITAQFILKGEDRNYNDIGDNK